MKLLLDTHIFLWGFLEPGRLRKSSADELENPDNELWLSPISIWECLVLADRRKIILDPNPETWVRAAIKILRPREAPVTTEVAFRSRTIDLENEDPADRFIASTAAVFELVLVTADDRLLDCDGFQTLRG